MSIPFSSGAVIREGWALARPWLVFLVVGTFVYVVVDTVLGQIGDGVSRLLGIEDVFSVGSGLILLVQVLIGLGVFLGLTRSALRIVRGEGPEWGDLFSQYGKLADAAIANLFYVVLVGLGCLLLVPALIWSVEFSLFFFVIVDEGLGPVAALKRSAALTQGAKWELSIFYSIVLLINVAGFCALVIGLLVTVPVTLVMTARFYERLRLRAEEMALLSK